MPKKLVGLVCIVLMLGSLLFAGIGAASAQECNPNHPETCECDPNHQGQCPYHGGGHAPPNAPTGASFFPVGETQPRTDFGPNAAPIVLIGLAVFGGLLVVRALVLSARRS